MEWLFTSAATLAGGLRRHENSGKAARTMARTANWRFMRDPYCNHTRGGWSRLSICGGLVTRPERRAQRAPPTGAQLAKLPHKRKMVVILMRVGIIGTGAIAYMHARAYKNIGY